MLTFIAGNNCNHTVGSSTPYLYVKSCRHRRPAEEGPVRLTGRDGRAASTCMQELQILSNLRCFKRPENFYAFALASNITILRLPPSSVPISESVENIQTPRQTGPFSEPPVPPSIPTTSPHELRHVIVRLPFCVLRRSQIQPGFRVTEHAAGILLPGPTPPWDRTRHWPLPAPRLSAS